MAELVLQSSSHRFTGIEISGSGSTHLGAVYHLGAPPDEQIRTAILEGLRYEHMGARSHAVRDAGDGTFEWVFDNGSREPEVASREQIMQSVPEKSKQIDVRPRENDDMSLRAWLVNDFEKIFWVTGKPGSGEPSLMDEDTDGALRLWAGERTLARADHFFWIPGLPMQRSYEGLLRSLLSGALTSLSGDTKIFETTCRERWKVAQSAWSIRDLKRTISDLCSAPSIRCFFIVNGLDECCPQEHLDTLVNELLWLASLPNVKLCVSSRPWNEFISRLSQQPMLRMEELTRQDMLIYVNQHISFANVQHPQGGIQGPESHSLSTSNHKPIAQVVVDRAEGVFLWIEMILPALKSEIRKGRDGDRLRQFVEGVPNDLESYFMQLIYDRIPKTSSNVSDTASAIKLALLLYTTDYDDIRAYNGLQHTFMNFWLLREGFLDQNTNWADIGMRMYSSAECVARLGQTKASLMEACKDFLVVVDESDTAFLGKGFGLTQTVQFFHRMVLDFLQDGKVADVIDQHTPAYFREPNSVEQLEMLQAASLMLEGGTECHDLPHLVEIISRLHQRTQGCELFAAF